MTSPVWSSSAGSETTLTSRSKDVAGRKRPLYINDLAGKKNSNVRLFADGCIINSESDTIDLLNDLNTSVHLCEEV